MKRSSKIILLAALLLALAHSSHAVPASPRPIKITQPDGTTLTVVLKGDEFHKYHVTIDGHLIKKDRNGIFYYATMSPRGEIAKTTMKANNPGERSTAEQAFVEQLSSKQPSPALRNQIRAKRAKAKMKASVKPKAKFPLKGTPRSLVILVHFSDLDFVIPDAQVSFTQMLNEPGYSANGATGSARDYFRDNTMNVFSPQFDVVGPYKLPKTRKFYGENDLSTDDDMNPIQMIVDACKVADDNGLDFSIYDTDKDGKVDNVFVFYAGHNEAESALDDAVWPHRWAIYPTDMYGNNGNYSEPSTSLVFDSKRIMDYACTSELRGDTGADIAGIGTFCHEFGHVLGLADMYSTDETTHFTLSRWSIMDAGAYLNEGKTPCAYNAFERFQLGYLTPHLLTGETSGNTLNSLISHNQAFLISRGDTYRLEGENPKETEFFLLENRQKTGWDAFLPAPGLLVYRINYNKNTWDSNGPNNDPDAMGVELIPADAIGSETTLQGDPFPGINNIKQLDLKQRNGKMLERGIRDITEAGNAITFSVRKPLKAPVVPFNPAAVKVDVDGFTPIWEGVDGAHSYLLNVYTKPEADSQQAILTENFSKFSSGSISSPSGNDISNNLSNFTQTSGWKGYKVFQAGGVAKMGSSSQLGYLITPTLDMSASEGNFILKFDAAVPDGDDRQLKIYVNNTLRHTVTDMSRTLKPYAIPFMGTHASVQIKFEGNKAIEGRFYLDNVEVVPVMNKPIVGSPFTVSGTNTSYVVTGIEADKYYYTVTAKKGEEFSLTSAEVGPVMYGQTHLMQPSANTLMLLTDRIHRIVSFYAEEGQRIEIISITGQKAIGRISERGLNTIQLPDSGLWLVKVGKEVRKVVL